MGVLVETIYIQPEVIKEEKDNGEEKVLFKGVFQKADVVNENGRRYPRRVLEKAIEEFKKRIKEGRAVGTLEHPLDGITRLDHVSHKIVGIELKEDGKVVGEFEVLDTAKGKDLKALLEAGVKVGISSRGFGTTKKVRDGDKDIEEVQDDFRFEAFDVVYTPSTPGGWVYLRESLDRAGLVRKEDAVALVEGLMYSFAEITEDLLTELLSEIEETVTEELSTRPDAKAIIAIEAIAKILSPVVPEIAEWIAEASCEEKEKLQEEAEELQKKLRELTVENYKLQKIAESAYPEDLKAYLAEARTVEEVDRLVEEFKGKKKFTFRAEGDTKDKERNVLKEKLQKFSSGGVV